ncbi:MAG: ATPase, partial [Bacteroidota bacterium]
MSNRTVATIYNPNLLSKKQLIGNYAVRLKKFQKLFKEIKTSTMSRPEQHILIEGQRGMGKTTLLLRLSYEVENDELLNTWLIPLVFNEEQYDVSSLSGLWELIAKYLGDKNEAFISLFDEMDSNYLRFDDNDEEYEKFIFNLLIRALKREGKKILLFIDNFGEMFSKLESESKRLREILMTCEHIRIIAASSVVSEAFFKYDEPLYEFFKIEKLNELTLEETKLLLLKLGESYNKSKIKKIVENEPERIETLRRLTGGVTRTIILLFEIFIDDETGNAFKDLESVLDRVTPLYKHRMDDLKPQPQKIVHSIAMNWDAIAVKEIAKKTRIPSKTVSAQLHKLVKNGIILKTETTTKNHLYSVRERFFNIWYLMRNGRKGDKNKVIWLARFFENWLNPKALRTRVEKFLQGYDSGAFEEEQISFLILLFKHPSLNIPKYQLR